MRLISAEQRHIVGITEQVERYKAGRNADAQQHCVRKPPKGTKESEGAVHLLEQCVQGQGQHNIAVQHDDLAYQTAANGSFMRQDVMCCCRSVTGDDSITSEGKHSRESTNHKHQQRTACDARGYSLRRFWCPLCHVISSN